MHIVISQLADFQTAMIEFRICVLSVRNGLLFAQSSLSDSCEYIYAIKALRDATFHHFQLRTPCNAASDAMS